VKLHTAEDCRIESMQAIGEVQVTSTKPIKPRHSTVQLMAAAVCARGCCRFVGGAEVAGGGMGAKLSVEDAEQEGATHRGRSTSHLCPSFAFLQHIRHWRRRRQAFRLITNLFDSSSSTALACAWEGSSSNHRLSTSSPITGVSLVDIQ
jgi:hypothetical protein